MNDLAIQSPIDIGPRVIHGLDFDEYRALDAINASGLKLLERSPAHFQQARLEPHAQTAAQALGTLVHLLVLEPERETEVAVAPECDRRTKAGKDAWTEFQAEAADRLIVTAEQWDTARRMRDAVRANPNALALLSDGAPEVTLLHTLDGTPIKCRLDWLCTGHEVIVDLKTASDASEAEFSRSAGRYGYHLQAALYSDSAEACGLGARAFVFLVVESVAPFGVALYLLDDDAMRAGQIRYQRALERYRECLAADHWPGYPTDIQPLSIPKWAL